MKWLDWEGRRALDATLVHQFDPCWSGPCLPFANDHSSYAPWRTGGVLFDAVTEEALSAHCSENSLSCAEVPSIA